VDTVKLDLYAVETLMPDLVGHDRHPSAFIVFLYLWSKTLGAQKPTASLSHQTIADGTGLSKRAVQQALRTLTRRRLVAARRSGPTAIIEYTVQRPWARA
jgi:hypothetical protein